MQYYNNQNRQFEADILTVGCIAGMMRMVVAVYRDLPLSDLNLDFVVDCSLCLIFLAPLILLRFKVRFEYISIPFSFLVIGFLCANWIVLDGIEGTGEYYFIGGMILIALINNGKWLVIFVACCLLLVVGLLYLSIYQSVFIPTPNPDDLNVYHYLWVSIVATVALLYHKGQFDAKRESLNSNKVNLESKIGNLEVQTIQLEQQREMLQKSNDWLEKNIEQRSEKLLDQRKSIEKYLSVTLFEIGPHLDSTVNSIKGLDDGTKTSPMGSLLIQSADHLQLAIQSVTNKIKKGLYYNPEN